MHSMTMHSWNRSPGRSRHCAPSRISADLIPGRKSTTASSRERVLYLPYIFIENAAGFSSSLFRDARLLLRAADERLKPNNDRLREFTDA